MSPPGSPPDPGPGPVPTPDAERLRDAEHVLHGPEGSGAWRQLLYVVYVVAILSGLYGFTVLRALVETLGPQWRADGLVGVTATGAALLAVALLVLGHLAGRRRGPVTPDLAWVDHVAASSVDRRLTLREAWRLPLTGLAATGVVGGSVVGGALWGGGAAGPVAGAAGPVGGLAYGTALAVLWLAGQIVADPAAARRPSLPAAVSTAARTTRALRSLGLEGLRAHSARSSRLGGAVLAGDPRALRLEAASPVRRGRHLRLRSRGPWVTLVTRDALGLRRQPLLLVGGVLLVATGAGVLGWYLAEPAAPVLAAVVAVLAVHLGGGLWGEGIRLLGDTLGAPRLLGGSVRREALAHSVLPAVLLVVVGLLAALPWTVGTSGAEAAAAVLAVVLLALVSVAAQWVSAFRVLPPSLALLPESGPQILLAWLAWPVLLAVVAGLVVTSRAAALAHGGSPLPTVAVLLVVGGLLAALARRALERAAVAHRD